MRLGPLALGSIVVISEAGAACGGKVATVDGSGGESSSTADRGGSSGEVGSGEDGTTPGAGDAPSPPPPSDPGPDRDPTGRRCLTFETVLNVFAAYNCGVAGCHGGRTPANLPLIDPDRPLATLRGFYDFRLSNGMPYVDLGSLDPATSGMSCNLRGTCGAPMPPPFPTARLQPADLEIVDRWLACGGRE